MPTALPSAPAAGAPFARLRTLVLNHTGATWQQVCRLQPVLPALSELHLCDCGIDALSADSARPRRSARREACAPGRAHALPTHRAWPPATWHSLRVLNLDGNALSDWAHVAQLVRAGRGARCCCAAASAALSGATRARGAARRRTSRCWRRYT